MIDIACLAVVGIVVWCVASEGIWGATHTLLCVLLSGLLAMNYFEPLANILDGTLGTWKSYSDVVSLIGLFTAFVFGLRLAVEKLSPTFIQVHPTVDQIGRWFVAAATGYVTMAILLTSLHTAPLPREFLGFKAEQRMFFGMAPDRQWLGFTQYVTEKPFGWIQYADRSSSPVKFYAHAFDGHYDKLGDPTNPYQNVIWPSFPIRYAARRDQLTGSSRTPSAPAPVTVPAPSGGNPAGGGANPGF